MKRNIPNKKNIGIWARMEMTGSTKKRASFSVSRPQSHEKRKLRQKPRKNKRKRKGQKSGCDKPSPLKEISSSRFGCSRNKYEYTDLRKPFPTRVSFFLCWLFTLNSSSDLPDWLWAVYCTVSISWQILLPIFLLILAPILLISTDLYEIYHVWNICLSHKSESDFQLLCRY